MSATKNWWRFGELERCPAAFSQGDGDVRSRSKSCRRSPGGCRTSSEPAQGESQFPLRAGSTSSTPQYGRINEILPYLEDHVSGKMAFRRRSSEISRSRVASARSPSFGSSNGRCRSCTGKLGPRESAGTCAICTQARQSRFDQGKTLSALKQETSSCGLARSSLSDVCAGRDRGDFKRRFS